MFVIFNLKYIRVPATGVEPAHVTIATYCPLRTRQHESNKLTELLIKVDHSVSLPCRMPNKYATWSSVHFFIRNARFFRRCSILNSSKTVSSLLQSPSRPLSNFVVA